MAILIRKLKAYTLMETIISMVIILFVFGIAMMIFINVIRTDRIVEKTDVFFKMNEILYETNSKKEYSDNIFEFGNFEIRRSVVKYRNFDKLKQVTVKAFDKNGKIVGEKSELMIDH
ncbi:MAG: hypothetical protein R2764_23100 [Bacteroidales bacterium]